jgi:protein-L-isoaspartate(D-aspartate) O-methyltransferase
MALSPAPKDAVLLEALDLHPGQRVLEIGTGSGDMTSLLASLVGENGLVISIEINEMSAHRVRLSLEEHGVSNVRVYHADGFPGYPSEAPYDRIIAHGSVRWIPFTWFEQLAPSGVLVGNLIGNLASVFLRLIKRHKSGHGKFLPIEGKCFVELYPETPLSTPYPPESFYTHSPVQEYAVAFDLSSLLENEAFLFFLQCELPHLQRYWRGSGSNDAHNAYLFDPILNASITAQTRDDTFIVRVYGNTAIWEQTERCYSRWQQRGHPRPVDFHFHMRAGKEYILYPATGEVWMLPM